MTSTTTRTVDNVVIATKGLQDRNINILAGTTGEIKGKLILTEIPTINVLTILYNNETKNILIDSSDVYLVLDAISGLHFKT